MESAVIIHQYFTWLLIVNVVIVIYCIGRVVYLVNFKSY